MFSNRFFIILSILVVFSYCNGNVIPIVESTLKQVHVIFRHGDRAPDINSTYPNDPHLSDTWYPEGMGQLTKLGKQQEYKLGQTLRTRYDKFLGNIYTPNVLDAWSTEFNRTKMSLELVLAGLWPPAPSQMWNIVLPWLPIPYNYLPAQYDTLLRFPLIYCPKYQSEFAQVQELPKFKNFLANNADLIDYINYHSGLHVKTMFDLMVLYFGLFAEEHTGRVLPEWTKKVYPSFLEVATETCYEMQTYTPQMLQSSGGRMVRKVLENAVAKIKGTLVPADRKIFLYSGHEYNIAHTLAALGLYKLHVPPYASYVLIELHKINDIYGFKIYYQDYKQHQPKLLTIPDCDSFCSIAEFITLTKDIVPTDNTC